MNLPWLWWTAAGSAATRELLGEKADTLVQLQAEGHRVPLFYVVTSAAFRAVMQQEFSPSLDERLMRAANCGESELLQEAAAIRAQIEQCALASEFVQAMRKIHSEVFKHESRCAVRSSAIDEDGREHSFAGMHATALNVPSDSLPLQEVKRVWASAFSQQAIAYRRARNLPLAGIEMAALVQQQIDARWSGVIFTCDPASGNPHELCISVVSGAGESLVSGGTPGETFYLDKQSLKVLSHLPPEEQEPTTDRDGKVIEVPVRQPFECSHVRRIADAALLIERRFRRPQDIEFCMDDKNTLFILQARPVTGLDEYGPAAGNHLIWDNSNIIESYCGVVSPMTFSFIRRAYTVVYHCFAEVMGISAKSIEANRDAFENMLGLFRGRVYYNLKNWYRLVRLFPGYSYNRRYMETMMGISESLTVDEPAKEPGLARRWFVEFPALLRLVMRTLFNFMRIRKIVSRFQRHFDKHYQQLVRIDFDEMAPHELCALYSRMENALLRKWQAPIINDFFVMVLFGALKQLCTKWCKDESGTLHNALLCGEEGLESAEPPRLLMRMARIAREDPQLQRLILNEPLESLPARIAREPHCDEFKQLMASYLDLYGFRSVDELKLETYSCRDRPHLVYGVLREYLKRHELWDQGAEAAGEREKLVRRNAEQHAYAAIAKGKLWSLRWTMFRWVLRNARLGVKNRENLRLARTRIYAVLRQILRSIGRHLRAEGILDDPDDLFYLTMDEVWSYIGGTAVTTDLRALVELRRAEYMRYERDAAAAPDNRFETYGMAYHRNGYRRRPSRVSTASAGLMGTGCCPGVVSGMAQVMDDPADGVDPDSRILVAERTDPGWLTIFPAFQGIIVERGSPLSHSAIVAREMGIPTIVGARRAAHLIKSGQHICMDGSRGTIELLDDAENYSVTSSSQKAE